MTEHLESLKFHFCSTCVRNTCAINALLQKDRRRQESQLRRSSGTQNVTGPTRSRSFCVPCVGGTTPDSSEWNPILTSSSSLPGTGGPGGVEAPAVPVRSYLFCHHQPAVSSSPAVQSRIRAQALGDHHYQNYQHTSLRHLQQTGAAQLGQNSSSPAGSAFHAHATYQNIFYGSRAQQVINCQFLSYADTNVYVTKAFFVYYYWQLVELSIVPSN